MHACIYRPVSSETIISIVHVRSKFFTELAAYDMYMVTR